MYKFIRKRDGRKVKFTPEKIVAALTKAGEATGEYDAKTAMKLAERVLDRAEKELTSKIPSVEQIQDITEETLMASNYKQTARVYILYRQERSRIRDSKSRLMSTYKTIAHAMAKDDKDDIKRSNANVDSDTAMGKMLQFGSEGSKEFAHSFLLKPEHSKAHLEGDIHIHDLDFYSTGTLTCCQTDPLKLFKNGFNTGHGFLRTPQSIASYAALAAIILQANQNEQHGGQSIPNFDYAMAPGVNKTYRKAIKQNIDKFATFTGKKVQLDEKQLEKLTFGQTIKGIDSKVFDQSKKDTAKQTFQAMEGFVHNLNTMHSRAGAQVPFTSINFGTDTTPEGHLVSEAFLEALEKGLGHGETPIFPISIFKVKEGINYNPDDPNYDLFKKSMAVSAKRLFPNFVFIDAPFNLQYYKKGDYNSEAVAMGCRTRVMSSVFPESDGVATSRGNLSWTTINLPRIGLKHGVALGERSKPDWDGFYKELDEKINLVADQLLERFEFQAERTVKNFPFLMGQGNWFGSEKLKPNDKLRDVIKHGSLSIGLFGLAETLTAMMGEHHGQSKEAQEKGLEIVQYLRKRCDELAAKHHLNFSLLATPAEGIAGRFTRIDKKEFGQIEGITDHEFYTNSYHVPVFHPIGAFDKINLEAPYHTLCNAGHITYVELDGDLSQNIEAFESVIRHMKESGIGYGSINHPVDRDPVCSFSGIITGDTCPSCGRKESDGELGFERLRRITGYLVGSLERWNDAKQAEEKARVKHSLGGVYNKSEKAVREQVKKSAKKAIGKA